jgi:carbamoyl-phosphate synthase large subunit
MMSGSAPRVLVTAVGGDLGQAVVKALRLSDFVAEIHGCDADDLDYARALVDGYFRAPPASEGDRYVRQLDAVCRERSLHAIVPASDPEIIALAHLAPRGTLPCGARVVCQDPDWLDTYGDKLTCMRSLEGKVPLAPFADGGDRDALAELVASAGFPLHVKPRRSSGSRDARVASDRSELDLAVSQIRLPLVQQFIADDHGEYSAGLFFHDGLEEALVFRRQLGPVGCSWYAQTHHDEEVLDYVLRVGRACGLKGSANVQVRKSSEGVRLLEVNPRFSSLAAARALCGFNDVAWSLKVALGLPWHPPERYRSIRFRRYFSEVVDLGEGFTAVARWQFPVIAKSTGGAGCRRDHITKPADPPGSGS